jgi:flagellar hook assembly protein FlgD
VFDGKVYASGVYQSSDRNLKQNIQEFGNAMDIIGKLKPRNYEFKKDEKLTALHLPQGKHYGLIAQDVEDVLPNLITEVRHNLSLPTQRDTAESIQHGKTPVTGEKHLSEEVAKREMLTTKAVNYIELIPIMIKGMQEQQEENKALKALLADQQQQLNELRQMVQRLGTGNTGAVTLTSLYLEQNNPNPVSGSTTIRYHIPENTGTAHLTITNTKGQLIRTISINGKGAGQVNLNTTMLAAGTYNYTLWADGKQSDTKRLVIVR